MMWKVFLTLLFVFSLFLVLTVEAASVIVTNSTVSTEIIANQIKPSEKAQFEMTITNNDDKIQQYSFYSLQPGWNVAPTPLSDRVFTIYPGGSYKTTITAQPLEEFSPGIYHIPISLETNLGERISTSFKIYLSPENPSGYTPLLKVDIDMDEKVKPTEPVSIKLFLENKNPLDLTKMVVKIQSDMPEFVKTAAVELSPLEKKNVEFTIVPNPHQQPKGYVLFFVFENMGEVIKVVEKRIEILSLLPEFILSLKEESVFLKKVVQLTATNDGNVRNTQEIKAPISFIAGIFSSSEGSQVKVINDVRYLTWEKSLGPDESTVLNVVINYRILVYILIVLLILIAFYLSVQSPVVLRKKAVTTESAEDGSLSEIKVTLELKNKSRKALKHIDIYDTVPTIANVQKSLQLGSLRPQEVRHLRNGTQIKWSLAELDSHEHRIITYKLRAKLNILGTFSLPRSTVEYAKSRKKKGKAYSNVVRLRSS